MDQALFARVQAKDRHAPVTADELDVGAGRTGDLAALARLHLDIVDDRADRDERSGMVLPGLTSTCFAGDHLVAGSKTLRSQDVGQLAIGILDQRDECGAVRIVFEPLDRALRRRTCDA